MDTHTRDVLRPLEAAIEKLRQSQMRLAVAQQTSVIKSLREPGKIVQIQFSRSSMTDQQ